MISNKISIVVFTAATAFGLLRSGESQAADCYSLSVGTEPGTLKSENDIPLDFALMNCGSHASSRTYYGGMSMGYIDYSISIQNEGGSELEKTDSYREDLSPENATRALTHSIVPGQKMTTSVNLSDLFHFERPGTYRVVVTTKVPDAVSGPQTIQSNTLKLVVESNDKRFP